MIIKKPKINILYILNDSSGGATQGIIELVKQIDRTKFTPYVIAPNPPKGEQKSNFDALFESYKIINMGWWNRNYQKSFFKRTLTAISLNIRTIMGLKPIFQVISEINDRDIDIVHTSTSLTITGAIAAKLTGKPHVWHIREPIGNGNLFRFWVPDKILAKIFDLLSTYIVPMSKFTSTIFQNHTDPTKLRIIYDGIDPKEFENIDPSNFKSSIGINSEELLVAMIGSLSSPWKKHDLFIKSAGMLADKHPKVKFAIFGYQPIAVSKLHNEGIKYLNYLKKLAQDLGINDRIIWAGFNTNIPLMMSTIDILVHTCDTEGFGRIAIEAMVAGKPVIGPNRGGISESVVDGETGLLVEPDKVEEFAQATDTLILNPQLRDYLGNNGKSRAKSNFSITKHRKKITDLYQTILSSK